MANLDITRVAAGNVKINRNGQIRYINNANNTTLKNLANSSGQDTIRMRADNGVQATFVVAEITNINGTPFAGTTAQALTALSETVFNP